MHESTADLERALEFMMQITQSAPEVKLVQSIEGIHGSIVKIGAIQKHASSSPFLSSFLLLHYT